MVFQRHDLRYRAVIFQTAVWCSYRRQADLTSATYADDCDRGEQRE